MSQDRPGDGHYRFLFYESPVAQHEIDREGIIRRVNRAECALLGYGEEEMVGRPVWELAAPEERRACEEAVRRKISAESIPASYQRKFIRRDGRRLHLEIWERRVRAADGSVAGLHSTLLDVTAQEEVQAALRKSEEQYRQLLECQSEGVVAIDPEGRFAFANPAACSLIGIPRSALLGRRAADLVGAETALRFEQEQVRRRRGEQSRYELELVRPDGERRTMQVTALPRVNDEGEFTGSLAVFSDVTEERRARAGQERLIAELSAEKERAEAATRSKSDFLSSMSHEIRTPLNGIIGMTGLLVETAMTPEQQSYAEAIRLSADSLLALVNDILDFSKIEAGKVELESVSFDLEDALGEVLDLLSVKAHEKGLEVISWYSPDAPRHFVGDRGRIRQILQNLIGNALKFTERGHVLVEADARPGPGGEARIRLAVHDTGIGIAPDKLPLVFAKFTQADSSTTRKYGGTGLGLSITRQLVELMGGTIEAASEPGEGSSFVVTLPLRVDRREADVPPVKLAGVRALVTDDNAVSRFVAIEWCRRWGVRADEAASPAEALERIAGARGEDDPYQAVILDYVMPEMDGESLARAIRETPGAENVALLLMTSVAQRGLWARFNAAGCDACLVKPIRPGVMMETLAEALGRRTAGLPPKPVFRASSAWAAPKNTEPRLAGRRVLVAEDTIVNQRLATAQLARMGCKAEVAANGREAVAMAARFPFDAILMDCQMPELDGFEATLRIRATEPGGQRVPIIAMTAAAMDEDRDKCLAAGMDDYLSKPVKPAALEQMLLKWIGRRGG